MISKYIRKSLNIIFPSIGLLLSCSALGENAPVTYKYGAKLDIVKVLSVSAQASPVCKPVDYILKYIDSSGQIQALKYRALSDACGKRR